MAGESGNPGGQQLARSTIGLAIGSAAATALAAALDMLPPADQILEDQAAVAVVVPREWRDATARAAAARIREKAASAARSRPTLLFRTPSVAGQAAAARRERWIEQPLGPGATRFDRVRVPVRVLDATRVFLTPAGGVGLPAVRPIAIGAAFAHPRQRAAARFAADPAAMAELAAPLAPRLTLALAHVGARWLAAATADPVAAELAWLGLAALAARRGEVVAWQDPGVQRLALLGPFVQSPAALVFAPDSSVDAETFRALAEELGVMLPATPDRGEK